MENGMEWEIWEQGSNSKCVRYILFRVNTLGEGIELSVSPTKYGLNLYLEKKHYSQKKILITVSNN